MKQQLDGLNSNKFEKSGVTGPVQLSRDLHYIWFANGNITYMYPLVENYFYKIDYNPSVLLE